MIFRHFKILEYRYYDFFHFFDFSLAILIREMPNYKCFHQRCRKNNVILKVDTIINHFKTVHPFLAHLSLSEMITILEPILPQILEDDWEPLMNEWLKDALINYWKSCTDPVLITGPVGSGKSLWKFHNIRQFSISQQLSFFQFAVKESSLL